MTLAQWLKDNNLSQAQFAKRVGISQSVICRLCSADPRWPNRSDMQKIYRETKRKVTPTDFLFPANGEPL